MKVTHSSTGEEGVVVSIMRGILSVKGRDGRVRSASADSFHQSGGGLCLLWVAGFISFAMGLTGGTWIVYSWTA